MRANKNTAKETKVPTQVKVSSWDESDPIENFQDSDMKEDEVCAKSDVE